MRCPASSYSLATQERGPAPGQRHFVACAWNFASQNSIGDIGANRFAGIVQPRSLRCSIPEPYFC